MNIPVVNIYYKTSYKYLAKPNIVCNFANKNQNRYDKIRDNA